MSVLLHSNKCMVAEHSSQPVSEPRENPFGNCCENINAISLQFQFQLPLSEVERRTLWVTVWHSDMFGRNDFLGELMLPLQGQIFDDPSPRWYGLQDRVRIHCCLIWGTFTGP